MVVVRSLTWKGFQMKITSLAKKSVKTATVSMLAAGVVVVGLPGIANAAGTSPKANNCYTQWWNTSWGQRCDLPGATLAGDYTSTVRCDLPEIPNRSMTINRVYLSTQLYYGVDCMYGASEGKIIRG